MKVFKETQRFTQIWLIVLLLIFTIIPVIISIKKYTINEISFTNLISTILILVLSIGFVFLIKLTTRIDEVGIHYQFFPIHFSLKTIRWNEVEKAFVRTYSPISEFGGWGLKGGSLWNKSNGKAINVSGDIGIQLVLKNGKKLLIGTQKENEAKRVLETYKSKII